MAGTRFDVAQAEVEIALPESDHLMGASLAKPVVDEPRPGVLVLHEIFGRFEQVITLEDGCIMGGFGSAVLEFMGDNNYHATVRRLGLPDSFVEHGTQAELYAENTYDAAAIMDSAQEMLAAAGSGSAQATRRA